MHLPEPPTCPAWCETDAGWKVSPGGVAQACRCDMTAGTDMDGDPVHVQLTRFAFLDGRHVEVCEPAIEVRCGNLSHRAAISLSATLYAAAQLVAN